MKRKTKLRKTPKTLNNSGRKYKDSLIRMLCKNKKRLIELINAVAHTNYKPTAHVEYFDVENKLIGRYGDIVCSVDGQIFVIIEHMILFPVKYIEKICGRLGRLGANFFVL